MDVGVLHSRERSEEREGEGEKKKATQPVVVAENPEKEAREVLRVDELAEGLARAGHNHILALLCKKHTRTQKKRTFVYVCA